MPFPRIIIGLLPLLAGCPGGRHKVPEGFSTDAAPYVTEIENDQKRARTFKYESRMDYRVGDERIKTTVLVMGQAGARLRFNALDPTGVVAADLACDGIGYQFVDFQKNCQRSGPCTGQAIAQLLRVNLEPDDFLFLAIGTTPIIRDPSGHVKWNSDKGVAEVNLVSADKQLTQSLILDGREGHYDVLESIVRDAAGEIQWRIENKDFRPVKGAQGQTIRLPDKTRFEQPAVKGDLRIRWEKQELDLELPAGAWTLEPPTGLPMCP